MTHYDYIFAGGGCSAYSLVYYLTQSSLNSKSILIIDPQGSSFPSKTWCYWSESPLPIHPPTPLVYWDQLILRKGEEKSVIQLKDLKYYHIQANHFFENLQVQFEKYPNIHFSEESVESCNPIGDQFEISTCKGEKYTCDYLFDSRIEESQWSGKEILKQQFMGWKIITDTPSFDPKSVTWMDFIPSESNQFSFGYILPYDTKSALVEFTCYSAEDISYDWLESRLKEYLANHLKGISYTKFFEEKGKIPMSTRSPKESSHPRWINLGTRAGWSRPSTGFTFQFIQEYCQELVRELEFSGITSPKKLPQRHYFYDNILLNIVIKWPGYLQKVFTNLFTSNSPDSILRFLQAKTGFLEEISILSKVRFYPFLKSLWHYEKH
ncbi:lycopene cyclase family protein [Algoriphagus mannitolivorans]|uniref:lycopene cyclase family protein n=1 Tax=Algoriphagus mannitolivorans TaxID=226504 RepID=UPI00068431EE|nr:lycopene cyclase family protein [Algoriphagus mannitolivorans]